MRFVIARGVNDAWPTALQLLEEVGEQSDSRNGPVLSAPHPVVTQLNSPCERVLLDEVRDANPFFHLFESIWMLAGANDARWLDRFIGDFSSRFGEPDSGVMHGAYGHRWRRHFDVDQLAVVVDRLKRDPLDRRAVIQMWDPVADLIGPDLDPVTVDGETEWREVWPTEPRDVCCNQSILPRVVHGALDFTVFNRSHDIVYGWGGANPVHFSVLQEWMAAALGAPVGKLYFVSNNWHAYTAVLERLRERAAGFGTEMLHPAVEKYPGTTPMVTVPHEFLRDCERWVETHSHEYPDATVYANRWFSHVAQHMLNAHDYYKQKRYDEALVVLDRCEAPDWQLAARRWIARRAKP